MNTKQGDSSSEEESKAEQHKDIEDDGNDDLKKNRRKRNDSKDREFVCGCGKNYLSYPALYTHIKQKHGGQTPGGTKYPCANGKGRKGRPKVHSLIFFQLNNFILKNTDQGSMDFENDLNDSEISEEDYDPLDELLYFLKTLGKYLKQEYDSEFFKKAIQEFPTEIFKHETQYYSTILDNLKQFEKLSKAEFQTMLSQEPMQDGLKTTKLNKIFAIFLYEISICITPECFKEIAYLVCIYREALNRLGWDTYQRCKGVALSKQQCEKEFCEEQSGELVLEVANDFMVNIFPQFANQHAIESFLIIGTDQEKKINTNYLTKHFCNWFYHKKYTKDKLSLQPDA